MNDTSALCDVDVVITHYNAERDLQLLLQALAAQTYPAHKLHIAVSDDGSAVAPEVPSGVDLIISPDDGFRAARARNLGAAQGNAEYILFLDGDTFPTPTYCAQMVEALQARNHEHGVLGVGTRRYADFDDVNDATALRFIAGQTADSVLIHDDALWLDDGYRRTDDLRRATSEDWRYIISAVMGVNRGMFERLGGFDESFTTYGGEDWEFAYRAWNHGASFVHAPAFAWHNGPDAAAREDFTAVKEVEQLELALRVPLPSVRGRGVNFTQPRVVVKLPAFSPPSLQFAIAESWLQLSDVGLWWDDEPIAALSQDARCHTGAVPGTICDRAQIIVEIGQPVELLDSVAFLEGVAQGPLSVDGFYAATTRDAALKKAVPVSQAPDFLVIYPAGTRVDLEAHARRRWR